jgi:hypothetical protein
VNERKYLGRLDTAVAITVVITIVWDFLHLIGRASDMPDRYWMFAGGAWLFNLGIHAICDAVAERQRADLAAARERMVREELN